MYINVFPVKILEEFSLPGRFYQIIPLIQLNMKISGKFLPDY